MLTVNCAQTPRAWPRMNSPLGVSSLRCALKSTTAIIAVNDLPHRVCGGFESGSKSVTQRTLGCLCYGGRASFDSLLLRCAPAGRCGDNDSFSETDVAHRLGGVATTIALLLLRCAPAGRCGDNDSFSETGGAYAGLPTGAGVGPRRAGRRSGTTWVGSTQSTDLTQATRLFWVAKTQLTLDCNAGSLYRNGRSPVRRRGAGAGEENVAGLAEKQELDTLNARGDNTVTDRHIRMAEMDVIISGQYNGPTLENIRRSGTNMAIAQ